MTGRLYVPTGDVAQMVERSLCMREARGSIPRISIFFSVSLLLFFLSVLSFEQENKHVVAVEINLIIINNI
jgi:hypothetical protein